MQQNQHTNQRDQLLRLLKSHAPGWVPLPEILALRIAQYNARIHELRSLGHVIQSKQDGNRSWFRLVTALASTAIPESEAIKEQLANAEMLFGELAPGRHRDDG